MKIKRSLLDKTAISRKSQMEKKDLFNILDRTMKQVEYKLLDV